MTQKKINKISAKNLQQQTASVNWVATVLEKLKKNEAALMSIFQNPHAQQFFNEMRKQQNALKNISKRDEPAMFEHIKQFNIATSKVQKILESVCAPNISPIIESAKSLEKITSQPPPKQSSNLLDLFNVITTQLNIVEHNTCPKSFWKEPKGWKAMVLSFISGLISPSILSLVHSLWSSLH